MTIQETEEFLVREKGIAEAKLGYNMCGKYARCLFCAQSDRFPCASAHERLEAAIRHASIKIPPWLLPEPPFSDSYPRAERTQYAVQEHVERREEQAVSQEKSVSGGEARVRPQFRQKSGVIARGVGSGEGVPVLKIVKKRKRV